MLDPGLMSEVPTRDYLSRRLDTFLSGSRHYEDRLDRLRIFAAEQRFLIGIRLLTGENRRRSRHTLAGRRASRLPAAFIPRREDAP